MCALSLTHKVSMQPKSCVWKRLRQCAGRAVPSADLWCIPDAIPQAPLSRPAPVPLLTLPAPGPPGATQPQGREWPPQPLSFSLTEQHVGTSQAPTAPGRGDVGTHL